MKKICLLMGVCGALFLASCNGSIKSENETADTTVVDTDSIAVDSLVPDSAIIDTLNK